MRTILHSNRQMSTEGDGDTENDVKETYCTAEDYTKGQMVRAQFL